METALTEKEYEILQILRTETGVERPMGMSKLCIRVKVKSVQNYITALRIKKFPICQKGRGYFYAHSDSQLDDFIRSLERKQFNLTREINALKESYFNVHTFERAFGADGKLEQFVTLAVRKEDRVAYEKFSIGSDGKPIIPEGTKLI